MWAEESGQWMLHNTGKNMSSKMGLTGDLVKSHFRGVVGGDNGG
jgi:hypothetical protein